MEREGVLNMTQDYISYIRSKVGHDKVILTFAGGILTDKDGRVLLQLRGERKSILMVTRCRRLSSSMSWRLFHQ